MAIMMANYSGGSLTCCLSDPRLRAYAKFLLVSVHWKPLLPGFALVLRSRHRRQIEVHPYHLQIPRSKVDLNL